MIKNKYTIYSPIKYKSEKRCFGHHVYLGNNERTIVPLDFSGKNINPNNFLKLKNKFLIKKIFILDKTRPFFEKACIVDHVNRSGYNFFIKSVPIKNFPMFPDMSCIYEQIQGLKKIRVHTLGPERFSKDVLKNEVSSEISGLIAPLWHYIDIRVSAVVF